MRCARVVLVLLMALEPACRSGSDPSAGGRPEPGVALALATERARSIHDVRYDLAFDIPERPSEPIAGREIVRFALDDRSHPVVLDFEPGRESLISVSVRGKPIAVDVVNGHIIIGTDVLEKGENSLEIVFRAGDASLNRNPDFIYALFVPARAHLAFPCFDQPDLKARYTLELTAPSAWQAVANSPELNRQRVGDRMKIQYAETKPIPTYLFTFATGLFEVESAERSGRTFHMFHRETDRTKVERNRDAIFDLHAKAIAWLEAYTQIPYPFGKFDFVLIPSFQFGGMEHPGAIYYNASSIMLDESATENQRLNRASAIAHETAHMWFGDLVTMRWFNDVWMKEVFANFMAAKIVNPSFPEVNHELRFLVSNYPAAYGVDRTRGTHPIRQPLENLNAAGNMYGAIIYSKAPIVMRQLERMLGPARFQEGMRAYLKQFHYGNATWLDLVKVLDERSDRDIAGWSKAWVEEAGRPSIRTEWDGGGQLAFSQTDSQPGRGLRWTQQMDVLVGTATGTQSLPVALDGPRSDVKDFARIDRPTFVLPTGGGIAYGDFTLDDASRAYLLRHLPELKDPVARGAAWVTLWEELLDRRVRPLDLVELGLRALPVEDTEQNVQLMVGSIDAAFWHFMTETARLALASRLEQTCRAGWTRASSSSLKSVYFRAFRSIVRTPEGIALLQRIWHRDEKIPGLTLAEPDEASMALELAVRRVADAAAIMEEQRRRFRNPDRQARFEFVVPALAADRTTREAWFERLKDVKNRRREPWALEGLGYLNHPLHAAESERYIRPALDLLIEIQRTGDIFFPKNWMDSALAGHSSRAAADEVKMFLDEKPDYPIRLRRIILQSADDLFRAAEIVDSR
ncbi:MAG: M1 family aminopeptidase [Acidobacteriota bacterium]